MKKFLTQGIVLTLLVFVIHDISGQINTLKITDPIGIAGEYSIQRFNWGPPKSTPKSALTAFVDDGVDPKTDACTDVINDLTGKIAFIDRGVCGLSDKALKAEKKGAIAVIICNTSTGSLAGAVGSGAAGAALKINAYMMSNSDCQKIRTNVLTGTMSVELLNKPVTCPATYDADVFYGNVPGQGDFNNGLNGWIVDNADPALNTRTTWYHSETGNPNSLFSFSSNDIASKTKCNGAAAIDLYDLQLADNPNFNTPLNRYSSSLISPPINCTGKNNVLVQFTMLHNRLNGNAQISFFDGTNWSAPRIIETKNGINTSAVSEVVSYPAPELANKQNCRVRFSVSGDLYYFILDDVILLDKKIVDIRVNNNWYAVSPSLRVPKDQVSEIPLLADIENIGNASASGTVLKVEFKNEAGNVISTLINSYGLVPGDSLVENKPFAQTYTPPAVPGRYTGSYIISSPDETTGTNTNNNADFEFYITDKTFGNIWPESEIGVAYMEDIADSWVINDITKYYSAGNVYYVKKGTGYTVSNVRFGLDNTKAEVDGTGYVFADLYELKDLNGISTPNSRTLVGTGSVFLENLTDYRNIQLPIYVPNSEGGPSENETRVALKDNTNYFLTIHASPTEPSAPRYKFLQYSGSETDIYDRSIYPAPANLAFDTLKINRICGSYWSRAGLNNTYEDIRNRAYVRTGSEALGAWSMAYIEMDVVLKSSTYDIAEKGEASIFPNPASSELFLDVKLEKVSQNVRVDLISVDGKVVTSSSFSNVQDSRLKMDLTNIVSGSYNALINTDHGVISRKVIVQK